MSKLKVKIQKAREKGIFVIKTKNVPENATVRTRSLFENRGSYCVYVSQLLLWPVAGLTKREAVAMAYEISVNPNKIWK